MSTRDDARLAEDIEDVVAKTVNSVILKYGNSVSYRYVYTSSLIGFNKSVILKLINHIYLILQRNS